MILTLIFLAIVLLVAIKSRIGALKNVIFLASMVTFGLIASGPIPLHLAKSVAVTDASIQEHSGKTLIILLGGGLEKTEDGLYTPAPYMHSRLTKAVMAFLQCQATDGDCQILISGGSKHEGVPAEADVFAKILQEMGIPSSQMILERNSQNTWQNAQYVSCMMDESFDQYLLITNALHAPRAKLYFNRHGLDVNVLQADRLPEELNPLHLGYNLFFYDVVIHERIGMARYHLYEWAGLNSPSTCQ